MQEEKLEILKQLKTLSEKFHRMKFNYVFDKAYNQHIIQALPLFDYLTEEFASNQIRFEINLINQFPSIDIFFISEKHGIDNIPEYEFRFPEK
jgi:hypothetical protein